MGNCKTFNKQVLINGQKAIKFLITYKFLNERAEVKVCQSKGLSMREIDKCTFMDFLLGDKNSIFMDKKKKFPKI